jgi:hypothetical protein
MEKFAQEPSRKQLRIDPHFECLKGKILSETLDILASMICDYIDKESKNE